MSSSPAIYPTQQPPPFPPVIQEQPYKSHSSHGSVGPVIGALAVIMVLGAVAVMIGRLCSGRRVMGHLQYDFEGWVETKCSSCIDGRLDPPLRRETVVVAVASNGSNVSSDEAAANVTPAVVESPEMTAGEEPPQAEEGSSHHQSQEQHSKHED